jgi:tetratricopeptide (TPR) repeat protein
VSAFLKKHLLEAILLAAITGAAAGWLKGLISATLPSTEGPRCWIEEHWHSAFGTLPRPDPDRFTVLVARLDRDLDGSQTNYVVGGFRGERGFRPLTTCRVVALQGEDQIAAELGAETEADRLRTARGADLILWGEVAERGSVLRVWMTGPSVSADLKAQPWSVNKGVLEPAFKEQFNVALQAIALTALAPATHEGQAVVSILGPLLPRLRSLATDPPGGLTPDGKGTLLYAAGFGFQTYGEQAGDFSALQEALAIYNATAREFTRERVPLQWAATQNNLGNVLRRIGERGDTTALRQARDIFAAALQERSRDRVPFQWAATKINMCIVLRLLGERGDDQARHQAVSCYKDALEVVSRDRDPHLWATIQTDYGNALLSLGDKQALHSAADAYELALQEQTQDRVPLEWAMTQNNLGTVRMRLAQLGEYQQLQQAKVAFDAALEERTRARVPLDWAVTETNIGLVLLVSAERGDLLALEGAIAAFKAALEERIRDRVPLQWAASQHYLGIAYLIKGRHGAQGALQQAEERFEAALQERDRGRVPFDWAATQSSLGDTLAAIGMHGPDVETLRRAVEAYKAALQVRTRDRLPLEWAATQNSLGNALLFIGARGDETSLHDAVEAYQAALDEFRQLSAATGVMTTERNLSRAQAMLNRRLPSGQP